MATIVNVQDPVSLNNLSIDINGRIGINNWPSVQTVSGTVSIATFPAVQQISGTVDVTDRALRQLGIVTISSGGVGTNTAPGYTIVQDGTTTVNKLKINSDGSINASLSTVQFDGSNNLKVVQQGTAAVTQAVGSALTPWTSQPTQTAAVAADTVLKFGSGGSTPFTHFSVQNNSTMNFVFSLDADSTAAGAKVYTLQSGQLGAFDRSGSTIHCHTASSVNFGGDTGITVEAFA